ncbi:co-chaperone DjlA [Mangrovitalea sediminis]|uniref:hypothetical protein n=1 Tax=Mangrovitalea sediminis TaxID=1982043 RepID=UPI001D0D6943|nr:hypothetical protein [Mangrovitalea sediminis]
MSGNIENMTGTLSGRAGEEFKNLLRELQACGHQAAELIGRAGLPRPAQLPLFQLLGYVARAEGRVTEKDIQFAESLIRALGFSNHRRRRAIAAFRQGKDLAELPSSLGRRLRLLLPLWPAPALRTAFMLCHAGQLNGPGALVRIQRVEEAVEQIGLPYEVVQDILESYRQKVWVTRPEGRGDMNYDEACRILGESPQASFTTLKQAYRRLVGQYHPDKLDANLSPTAKAAAKEQMLRYQEAWQRIRYRHQSR